MIFFSSYKYQDLHKKLLMSGLFLLNNFYLHIYDDYDKTFLNYHKKFYDNVNKEYL